jgi:hypothetical protein
VIISEYRKEYFPFLYIDCQYFISYFSHQQLHFQPTICLMKKLIIVLILCCACTGILKGQNPIPSFNTPVYSIANFQEGLSKKSNADETRGKRTVVVHSNGQTGTIATVYVYCQDFQTIYGPYTLYGGQTLQVEIDDREWGVMVTSEDHITVDVWITEELSRAGMQSLR